MRYLILSDIHSNIQAFVKVVETEKYDKVLFLGDIIGYGGDPYLCYKKFLELGGTGVLGNHEYGAVNPHSLINFSENARLGVLYSIKNISAEYLNSMVLLKSTLIIEDFILCHAMLNNPLQFYYVFPEDKDSVYLQDTFSKMAEVGVKVMFTGHTHKPCIFKQNEKGMTEIYKSSNGDLFLDDNYYVINVGSVGQSRNNVPKAHYVVYDSIARQVSFKSLEYNIKEASKSIEKAGLPDFLAERLFLGI